MELLDLGIPTERQPALASLRDRLHEALGDDLASIVVYGDAGELTPISELDVLVVIAGVNVERLNRIGAAVRAARREGQISVLVLDPREIASAADVFPIKFLEIKRTGRVMVGDDPFRALEIDRGNLRLRCEQELRNIAVKLRRFYLLRAANPGGLATIVAQFLPPLVRALRYLLSLQEAGADDGDRRTVLETACRTLEVDPAPVPALLEAATGTEGPEGLVKLVAFMMRLSQRGAAAADRI